MGILGGGASPIRGGSGAAVRSYREVGAAMENLKSYHAVAPAGAGFVSDKTGVPPGGVKVALRRTLL
jgi:hypothetical protein